MHTGRLAVFGLLLTAGLVAWKVADDPVPVGPYPLRYPASNP